MNAQRLVAAAFAALLLAACGGGGGGGGSSVAPSHSVNVTPTATSTPATSGAATAAFALTIPSASTSSANARRPAFVSPAIASVAIFATIGTAAFPPTATTLVNVGPNAPGCTSVAAGTTCTIDVPATYGPMSFEVNTYSGTLGSGSLLSQAQFSTTIVPNQTTIPLTLTGIVSSVNLSLSSTSLPSGSGTVTLNVNALDPSGAIIVGSGTYSVPISVRASDPSVTLSASSVTGPNQPITVTAPKPTIVEFTASATGLSANAFAPAVLTVGSTYSRVFVGNNLNNSIMVFPSTASFPMAPLYTIYETSEIGYMGANASGTLVVAPYNTSQLLFYAPGATTPSTTITAPGITQGVALDASGNTYWAGYNGATPEIATYPPSATTPTNVIAGPATTLNDPDALAVDGSGNLVEIDYGVTANVVNVWTAGHQNGNVAPTLQLATTPNLAPVALAASATGSIAVDNFYNTPTGQAVVKFFAPGATTPSQTWEPVGNVTAVAYAPNGDLFAAASNDIGVLAAGSTISGYSRSFGPLNIASFLQPIAVGGTGTQSAPATTTVSGDFIAWAANKTWNYAATPATGTPATLSVYGDPSPDVGGNTALVGFFVQSVVPDAAAAGGTIVGAIGLSTSAGAYHAQSFGSVSNSTYGTIPGAPLLVPSSLTYGQQFATYPGVTATVTGVGAVPGMSACPGSPTVGATVTYVVNGIAETASYVPGCGITDFVTDNGTELRLTSITSNPQLGEQAIARRVISATIVDTVRSGLSAVWKHYFVPWVKR